AALHAAVFDSGSAPAQAELEMLTGLWVQRGEHVNPAFRQRLARLGGATVEELDFERAPAVSPAPINASISDSTPHRSPNLVGSGQVGTSTRRVLASAIYFKAPWEEPFNPFETRPLTFRGPDGETSAQGMGLHADLGYAVDDELEVLELPYAGDGLDFLIILPRKVDGLARGERRLCADPGALQRLLDHLQPTDLAVTLPRFTFPFETDLVPALRALGVRTALAPGAEFSEIGLGFFLDVLTHGAWVEVNERGTEAAGATVVTLTFGRSLGRPRQFVADHPFLFLIQHRTTRSLLFLGRGVRP